MDPSHARESMLSSGARADRPAISMHAPPPACVVRRREAEPSATDALQKNLLNETLRHCSPMGSQSWRSLPRYTNVMRAVDEEWGESELLGLAPLLPLCKRLTQLTLGLEGATEDGVAAIVAEATSEPTQATLESWCRSRLRSEQLRGTKLLRGQGCRSCFGAKAAGAASEPMLPKLLRSQG